MRGPAARPLAVWFRGAADATPLAAALAARRPAPLLVGRTPPPHGTTVIVAGLEAWAGPWPALLSRRPDLRAVAVLDEPLDWDWPEFVAPAACATAERATAALAGAALAGAAPLVIVPDAAAAAAIRHRFGPAGPQVAIEPVPSSLAGTEVDPAPAPAVAPFMVALGPIEARSNALLLLQLWRDGLARSLALPRLVLAGPRGQDVEEIAPLLDWNPWLRRQVTEAPELDGPALRRLITGARAILAPDFAAPAAALLRDAVALGVPVIAADTPQAHALGLTPLLNPIDGPGWRAAILAVSAQAPAPPPSLPRLLDWPGYAERLVARAEALP